MGVQHAWEIPLMWPFTKKRKPKAVSIREATTARSADIPENEHLWRSLMAKKRDLLEVDHDRQREIALWLRLHNGFAKRFEEILVDFTAGEEPIPKAEDEKLQGLLDDFWGDPVNQMASFARELAGQLRVIGEQFVTAHIRETDGRLRLGYLDPGDVAIVASMPKNSRDLVEVHTKGYAGKKGHIYRIVRPGEELEDLFVSLRTLKIAPRDPDLVSSETLRDASDRTGYDGLAFAFSVNRLSNASRGVSDFFSVADYLDGMDKATFNAVERSFILNTLAWEQTCQGVVDDGDLKKHQANFKQAIGKPGGIYTKNEAVTVAAHAADLKSADMEELVKIVKLIILGSWGFPLHWFSDGGEANLATAGEMGGPTIRKLQSAQTVVRSMLRTLCDFQIALKQARAPESVSGIDDLTAYQIILPEIVGKDTSREAAALGQVTMAIVQAVEEEWLTRKTAALWWQEKAQQILGAETRPEDMELLDKLDEDQAEEMEEEPRPGDDGEEPDPEEDPFEANQKKPLPPEMEEQAEKLKKGAA